MEKEFLSKFEVRAIFRRNAKCREIESSLLDCIADAVGEAIEENNRRFLEKYEGNLMKKG